jgi:DNA-binding PadR family transcriptional regulator
MLKYTLLGFLSYAPMTGYELKQRIDRSTAHFWHAKLSQIYVTLKALEEEGCVTSVVEAQAERPDRRIYSITEAGRKVFHTWLAEPYAELSPKKETLILKFFFSAQLDLMAVLAQLHLQRARTGNSTITDRIPLPPCARSRQNFRPWPERLSSGKPRAALAKCTKHSTSSGSTKPSHLWKMKVCHESRHTHRSR